MDRGDLLNKNGSLPLRNRHVTIVANPAAGSTTRDRVAEMKSLCRIFSDSVDVWWTECQGHATAIVAQLVDGESHAGPPDMIVSVGGDGTLREVVEGMARSACRIPLVVMPGGTGNSNYRSLWDDVPWGTALESALTLRGAELRYLDLARVDGLDRIVVLGVSTGLFAEATAESRSVLVGGRDKYQQAISRVLNTFEPYMGRVVVDGRVVHSGLTTLVNVGGGRHRAGVYNILPRSVRDDGLLDVCVLDAAVPPLTMLDLTRSGDHLGREGVTYARGRRVTLERTDGLPLRFESDGEALESDLSSITVEVLLGGFPAFTHHLRPGG
ncbi:diacylglycerol kinase family protein [Streptomyces sp. Rer75]|uniref:diacylglycerol/lipid kinase family protein n=1 Tax=Streptomyces sp. Rer75 TaxID=2750011 RepID=UPI0015CF931A|nr:diacylglycerol kinase family protein [Streptomyces sp. Rer75]QLH19354.1 VlmJ-like protein [Streptomyces sp. Rer75]